jgi:hypothetical protein
MPRLQACGSRGEQAVSVCLTCNYWEATVGHQCEACAQPPRRVVAVLPENTTFPWNDMIELTSDSNRGVGIALSSVHDQLCVIADLLRLTAPAGEET